MKHSVIVGFESQPQWHGTCEISSALGNPVLPREAGLTGSVGTERTFLFPDRASVSNRA